MKKFTSLILLLMAFLMSSTMLWAQPNAPINGQERILPTFNIPERGTDDVLYSQLNLDGWGNVSQDYEAIYDAWDSQGADDFIVPTDEVWNVTDVTIYGANYYNISTPATHMNVYIFPDMGGYPGETPIYSFENLSCSVTDTWVVGITLPDDGVYLPEGRHWISVQAREDFDPSNFWFYWTSFSPIQNLNANWRNPGGSALPGWETFAPASYDFNFSLGGEVLSSAFIELPVLTDMGVWAFGAWQEPVTVEAINLGLEGTITSLDLDDPNGYYSFTAPTLPVTLAFGETLPIELSFNAPNGITDDDYTAVLVATYDGATRDVAAGDLTVYGYEPLQGDVVEYPWVGITIPGPSPAGGEESEDSREYNGRYLNYHCLNDAATASNNQDRVWEIVVEADALFSVWLNSGTNTNITLYAEDFGGAPGPMAGYEIAQDATSITDFPMFIGTYYMVISADGNFNRGWSSTYMTAPAAVDYDAPMDGAVDIVDGDFLIWQYVDTQVEEYQVILGTTYPPTDVVVDWTTAGASGDVYELAGLEANLQYFWQINVRNNVGTTEGDIWGFTTTISPPLDLAAASEELFEGDFTELSWTSPLEETRALLGYNVYREGSKINTTLVTGSTYTDTDVLAYKMAPGYEYYVTSVFDEGESAPSASVFVEFSGEAVMSGTITDAVTGLPIEGANVNLDGLDEYSNPVEYDATTNASGIYTQMAKVGTYEITASAAGYVSYIESGVSVNYPGPNSANYALNEIPYPVASVTAVELSDDEVEITWVEDASRELLGYTVYRVPVLNEPGSMIPVLTVGNTTGGILIDEDWGTAAPGVYKWAVEANYTLNNSAWVYSNTLDKDMETVVNVEVTTEFGDDPLATVTFTNKSEPALALEYTQTLDATGEFTFDPFRKGTYDVTVELDGYDPVSLTGEDIWEETDYAWLLDGAAAPPENLTVDNDSLYMGEDAKLSWDVPASSEFHGYIVYRDGVALFDIPIAETSYTDVAPPYNMDVDGYVYTVTAVYLTVGESDPSNAVSVWVTGKGMVDGTVYDGRTDLEIEGAQVKMTGFDEFGYPQSYVFMTDEDGYYEDEDGVWAGDYDYSVTAMGYSEVTDMRTVNYNNLTTQDFVLFPAMAVTATEQDENNVLVEWSFDMDETRELIDFTTYRTLWNVDDPDGWTELGATTGSSFIDSDWGTVASGVYKWVVEANYADGSTIAFSNYLDKDMETVVNVEVVLNTAESPEGTEVTITNMSEPYLDLEYVLTMDASGMATIDAFRKGTYEVEVSLFGFATIYDLVVVDDTTDLYYVLQEQITAVSNLYVNPNGYATWDIPVPGGLEMFVSDFEGGIPATITQEAAGSGVWESTVDDFWNDGYIGDGAISYWGYGLDHRMNTPKVALEDGMVVQFAWQSSYYWSIDPYPNADLTIEISLNEGLTWTPIWSFTDIGAWTNWTWYETTLDLEALGYTDGDAMFSAHVVANDNGDILFDEWYIGPAPDATAGTVAISTPAGVEETTRTIETSTNVEKFSNNLLASANSDASRSLLNFKVSLDEIFSGDTEDMFYDYEEAETLVEGTEYEAKVEAVYTTGISDPMYYTFIYHACDYYNDAEDFTATRVEGTLDIMLEWTNDDSDVDVDEFVGTNVYRDGEMIAFVEAGTEMYTDEDLASGTYNYCVTQVYESEAESCEVCDEETMTAGGYVNGYVTEFATGDPIEGATVTLVDETNTFEFTTDADGYYEGEVVEGTYDYTASAEGYASEMLADVFIDFGATVSQDFALKHFPYPVGQVIATEQSDNEVLVEWSGIGGDNRETYIFEDFQGQTSYTDVEIPGWLNIATVGSRAWFAQSFSGNLYAQGTSYNSGEVNVMYLITPVINLDEMGDPRMKFQSAQAYWNHDGLSVLISNDFDGTDIEGATWDVLNCNLAGEDDPNHAWINSGIISLADYSGDAYIAFKYEGEDGVGTTSYRLDNIEIYDGGVGIEGYNVYRGPCDGTADDMEFLGFTLDQTFTDNTWGTAEAGIYTWAVEVVYENNMSEFAYSNCLDKDMITTVTVEVSTNSGDSPEGTEVMFTNVSEITDPPIVFETELDASGIYTWDDFRKGRYDIYVHLNGFTDITLENVLIWDEAYFEWVLEELLAPPADLYVTPTGFATWRPGGIVPFELSLETFDEGLPETWTIIDGGDTDDTWFWTTDDAGSTLDGTPFMFVDSDAAGFGNTLDETLISPIYENTENADMLYLEFDQYFNTGFDAGAYADVDVFDGDEWINVLHMAYPTDVGTWAAPDHQMIDVTEYANPEFQVRFFYHGSWDYYWAVDNVAVTEGSKSADRMLEYYKVWHDYTFVTDEDTTYYQYGDNGEALVPGETYMAEVAAVYSTGISAKMMYEWTYLPCDSFPGPAQFMAENVEDTKDVLVTWSYNDVPAGDEFFEGFESGTTPTGWVTYDEDGDGQIWQNTAVDDFGFDAHTGDWCMTSASWTALLGPLTPDNWLVTPPIYIGPASELSFWVDAQDPLWPDEQYYVKVSTTGNAVADFTTTIHSALSPQEWEEVVLDLSDFAGETIYIAFQHADCTDQFYLKIDDVAVSNTTTRAAYTAPVAPGTAEGMPFKTAGMDQLGIKAMLDQVVVTNNQGGDKSSRATEAIGMNVYRDGEMIAYVALPDTSFLDEDLVPGYYDYCIATVYTADEGAHTWTSCMQCIEDVLVPEDCDEPYDLTATLDEETYDAIYLAWNQGSNGEWLSYGDGPYVAGIGLNPVGLITVAIQFDPSDLTAFDGMEFSMVNFRYGNALLLGDVLVQIWENDVLILEETATGIEVNAWNEVSYASPVVIDASKTYKIGYSVTDWNWNPDGPCGAQDFTGSLKSDLVLLNGVWDNLSNYLPNSWLLEVYVSPAGKSPVEYTPIVSSVNYTSATAADLVAITADPVYDNNRSTREFMGYNIYRDGDVIEELWPDNTYTDTEGLEAGNVYCYEVTSMYSVCGESDPSNEACAGFVGIPELDAGVANLYPNPARDQITIEAADMTRLHIVNYVGQVVYDQEFDSSNSRELHTQNYQSGVYVARIYTEKGVITKRFIINR